MSNTDHYKILHEYKSEDQYLVMNEVTRDLLLKKTLKIYDIDVFRWLSHNHNKHIPNIVDYKESEGTLIVTEQFIAGTTLDEYVSKMRPSEKELISLFTEICDGLTFLHSAPKPIIHRDLKVSNILVTDDGTVKIIDYDAAKTYKAGEMTDTVLIGTEGSAAPEQYGFAQSDPRTDIFALGVLIKKLSGDNSHLNKIASKASNLDPNNRYQSAEALKRALLSKDYNPLIVPITPIAITSILIVVLITLNAPNKTNNILPTTTDSYMSESVESESNASSSDLSMETIDDSAVVMDPSASSVAETSIDIQQSTSVQVGGNSNPGTNPIQSASTVPSSAPAQTAGEPAENTTAASSSASSAQTTVETTSIRDTQAYSIVYYYTIEGYNYPGDYLSYEDIIARTWNSSIITPESEYRAALDSIVAEYGIDFRQRAYENAYFLARYPSNGYDMIMNSGYSEARIRSVLSNARFTQSEIDYACSQFDWNQEAVYYCNYLTIRPHSGGPYSWDRAVQLCIEEAWFTQEQAEAAATQVGFTNDIPPWLYSQ